MERRGLSRHARSTWHPAPWLAGTVVIVFGAGGLPLTWLALVAIRDVAGARDLVSPRAAVLLQNTVVLALLAAGLVGLLGTVLGIVVSKTNVGGRKVLTALLTFPLFLPPYLLALGWFTVLGRSGLLASILGPGLGVRTSDNFFGLAGAVLVLTIAYTPIVMHLVGIGLRGIDPAAEEAARLRFRWPPILRWIDLPLIAPAVALGMLVTFILVVGEFGVPAYLRYPVFSGAIFTEFAAFLNIQGAVMTSLPLGLLVFIGVLIERFWLRERVQFLGRARMSSLVIPLGAWRVPTTMAVWGFALVTVVLPLAGLVGEAGAAASYGTAVRGAWSSIADSLWTAATAATIIVAAAVPLSYIVERTGRERRNGLDTALIFLFAAPGTVLGVALILFWNQPGLTSVYATAAVVVIGYVAHYTPLAARAVGVGFQTLSPGMEEAARLAGVSWTRTLRGVLLPVMTPALAGAWFLSFVFCLRDLDLVMTVHPPGFETLPVRVYTLMANSPGPVTAALALVIVMLTAAVLLVGGVGRVALRRLSWR